MSSADMLSAKQVFSDLKRPNRFGRSPMVILLIRPMASSQHSKDRTWKGRTGTGLHIGLLDVQLPVKNRQIRQIPVGYTSYSKARPLVGNKFPSLTPKASYIALH